MRTRNIEVLIWVTAIIFFAATECALAAQEKAAANLDGGSEGTPALTATTQPDWLHRDRLTGDWGGARPWLKEHGITLKPRVTQFYQGLAAGEGAHSFEYGGKADLMLDADLNKLGLWKGFSMNVHYEYNFGESANGLGGTLIPVNTALQFPGIQGSAAYDLSSLYFMQTFGDDVSLKIGKINLIDLYAGKLFQGGGGYDSFWNLTFAAPPSGTVPAYLLASMLSVRTKLATYGLWIYDPTSVVNKSVFDQPFHDGVTFRSSVEFPVTIAGLDGHQGFVATYSTKNGTDLNSNSLGGILLPPRSQGYPGTKNNRYYFGYNFNQYLFQSKGNPNEGVGLFGQFGISDGNPNPLHWSVFAGLGGTGLIPGRKLDNWGIGYYYDAFAKGLKELPPDRPNIRDEQGFETFYNFAVTPWLSLGADLQVIQPAGKPDTAVFPGLRTVIRF
jgi:porin